MHTNAALPSLRDITHIHKIKWFQIKVNVSEGAFNVSERHSVTVSYAFKCAHSMHMLLRFQLLLTRQIQSFFCGPSTEVLSRAACWCSADNLNHKMTRNKDEMDRFVARLLVFFSDLVSG